jgi:hypothetical protein
MTPLISGFNPKALAPPSSSGLPHRAAQAR